MEIGAIIKRLRRNKDMTQEDLAEFLNISPQAVSRWETNQALPDITLLPSLANLFGITTDELLGMDEIRNQAYLGEIYRTSQVLIEDNKFAEAADMLRKAVKTFPGNYGVLSCLALALSYGDVSTKEGRDSANEAIKLCERVLENNISNKLRGTTNVNLCYLYKITGADRKALELGRTLPHIWESREMILPELLEGQEAADYLGKSAQTILGMLVDKIISAETGKKDIKKIISIGQGEVIYKSMSLVDILGRISSFLTHE